MRTRNLLIGIGLVTGVSALILVIVSLHPGAKEDDGFDRHEGWGELVTVVVPKWRIKANQPLDSLVKQGRFEEIQIPKAAVVEGAVTRINQLEGTRTTALLKKNEMIPARLLVAAPKAEAGAAS